MTTLNPGDIVHSGPGRTRFTVTAVSGTWTTLRYPNSSAVIYRQADALTLVQAAPQQPVMAIVKSDRPQDPPYIFATMHAVAPGDVLEVRTADATSRNHASGTRALKTVATISEPRKDKLPYMPFLLRDVVFTDGTTSTIGDVTMHTIWGGPKFDQRNNPAQVTYIPAPLNLFRWDGKAQEQGRVA